MVSRYNALWGSLAAVNPKTEAAIEVWLFHEVYIYPCSAMVKSIPVVCLVHKQVESSNLYKCKKFHVEYLI